MLKLSTKNIPSIDSYPSLFSTSSSEHNKLPSQGSDVPEAVNKAPA